jgi:hypothetical protein
MPGQILPFEVNGADQLAPEPGVGAVIDLAQAAHGTRRVRFIPNWRQPKPPVQPVVGVVVAFLDRLQQVLAFVQVLPDAPFLEADKALDGGALAARAELRQINAPPALLLRPVERQRFRHAAHVHVVKVAVLADEIKR